MSRTQSTSTLLLVAVAALSGCADATLPFRERLAVCIIKAGGPLELDYNAIEPEMHRMHTGYEDAWRRSQLLEEFLATTPKLDTELLELVEVYAKSERKLAAQFKAAIDDERSDLTEEELAISSNCSLAGFGLLSEICKRIEFDSLVTSSE